MEARHRGSCLCGAVTFKVHGDFERFFLGHGSCCRKDTDSAHCASQFSSTVRLEWLSGQDRIQYCTLPKPGMPIASAGTVARPFRFC
jgi:hypothetical protein